MDIKKIIFVFVIFAFIYGCANMQDSGERVFLNLQSVSSRIIIILTFEKEDEDLIKQLEVFEEQINTECSAIQQIGYRRLMGDPVSVELKYKAATSLQTCNKKVIQVDQFLKERGL